MNLFFFKIKFKLLIIFIYVFNHLFCRYSEEMVVALAGLSFPPPPPPPPHAATDDDDDDDYGAGAVSEFVVESLFFFVVLLVLPVEPFVIFASVESFAAVEESEAHDRRQWHEEHETTCLEGGH